MGLRVRAAGLKVFMVSIDDLVCQLCIGCSLSLSNIGTKLCVITDILVLSYSFFDWYHTYKFFPIVPGAPAEIT